MVSRKWARAMLWVWVSVVLVWFVGRSDGMGGQPLVSVWAYDPGDYDPHHTSSPMAYEIFRHVCEPLFYQDSEGELHGVLAEDDIAYRTDGQVLTVTLRSGITFHDGTPLNADAVVASFERLRRLGASPLLNELRNVSLTAGSDGRSVVFSLSRPDYEFASLVLSSPYAVLVSPQAEGWSEPGFVACTGAYQFAPSTYRPGDTLTLIPYPDYHHVPPYAHEIAQPAIHRLIYRFEPDREARLQLLTAGPGCILSLSRRDEIPPALSHYRYYSATGGVTYLGFNFQRHRWQDPRLRAAIAMAIDRNALAAHGPYTVAETPLRPGTAGYNVNVAPFGYAHDPRHSRTLVSATGMDGTSEIVLLIPASHTYRTLAADLQQQLAAVGLSRVRIREVPREDLLAQRQDFDLLLFDYAWSDYTALGIFLGPGPRNLLNYPGDDVATLIAQARVTADQKEQHAIILEAQAIVLREAIWHPLLIRQIVFAVDERCVSGERATPFGELIFWDARTLPAPF